VRKIQLDLISIKVIGHIFFIATFTKLLSYHVIYKNQAST